MIKKDAKTSDGNYSGTSVNGGVVEPGINAPYSKVFTKAVWFLDGAPGFAWNVGYSAPSDPHLGKSHIRLAQNMDGPGGTGAQYPSPWNGPLNVEQAASIDLKLDDGKPGLGEVMVHAAHITHIYGCATTTTSASAEYNFAQKGDFCYIGFWLPNFELVAIE